MFYDIIEAQTDIDDMISFGERLTKIRKSVGLTQAVLAQKAGMSSVQLCKIEKGTSSPTLATVERIGEALGLSVDDIISFADTKGSRDGKEQTVFNSCNDSVSRFVSIRDKAEDQAQDIQIIKRVVSLEDDLLKFENQKALSHATLLLLQYPINQCDITISRIIANNLRNFIRCSDCCSLDLAENLELHNVRIHRLALDNDIQSRSYYDTINRSYTIVLNKKNTPERHVYRLAYELGWMVIFASLGFKPVRFTQLRYRFARAVASEFLMPEESVRFFVGQLGIRPNDWTLETLSHIKSKFGVSAEAFALRLESLGLIGEHLRQHLRDELHEYYKAHPKEMEPAPRLKPLNIGFKVALLEKEVARREAKG